MICSGIYNGRNFNVSFDNIYSIDRNIGKGLDICGIYAISGANRDPNIEASLYIGSSNDIVYRLFQGHINILKRNEHYNLYFQRYVNKYGYDNLKCFCLENCNESELLDREQNWLDYYNFIYNEKSLFNSSKTTFRITHTKEGLHKIQTANCKDWIVITPDNVELEVNNLNEFCIRNKISRSVMTDVAMGKVSSNKGYKCFLKGSEDKANFNSKLIRKEFIIIYPDGKVEEILGLHGFSKNNNLNPASLHAVATGRLKHHKGFVCKFKNPLDYNYNKRVIKEKILIDKNGVIIKFNSVTKFCKENSLKVSGIKALLSGYIKNYKGYRVKLNE